MMFFTMFSRRVVSGAARRDGAGRACGPRTGVTLVVLFGGSLYLCVDKLRNAKSGVLVLINFLTALFLSYCVFEPASLVFMHDCCKTCCPCIAPCCINEEDIPPDDEEAPVSPPEQLTPQPPKATDAGASGVPMPSKQQQPREEEPIPNAAAAEPSQMDLLFACCSPQSPNRDAS